MNNKYMVVYNAPSVLLKNTQYIECDTREEITDTVKRLINEGATSINVGLKIPFEVNVKLTR